MELEKNIDEFVLQIDREIERLSRAREHFLKGKNLLSNNHNGTETVAVSNSSTTQPKPPSITIGDAAAQVLLRTGGPMEADALFAEAAKLGVTANKETFISIIRKDRRKRFKLVGRGTFDLANRDAARESKSVQHQEAVPLLQMVREIIKDWQGDITQREIKIRLIEKNPKLASRVNFNATVSGALKKLTDKKELELARKGYGSEPHVYRKVQ